MVRLVFHGRQSPFIHRQQQREIMSVQGEVDRQYKELHDAAFEKNILVS